MANARLRCSITRRITGRRIVGKADRMDRVVVGGERRAGRSGTVDVDPRRWPAALEDVDQIHDVVGVEMGQEDRLHDRTPAAATESAGGRPDRRDGVGSARPHRNRRDRRRRRRRARWRIHTASTWRSTRRPCRAAPDACRIRHGAAARRSTISCNHVVPVLRHRRQGIEPIRIEPRRGFAMGEPEAAPDHDDWYCPLRLRASHVRYFGTTLTS